MALIRVGLVGLAFGVVGGGILTWARKPPCDGFTILILVATSVASSVTVCLSGEAVPLVSAAPAPAAWGEGQLNGPQDVDVNSSLVVQPTDDPVNPTTGTDSGARDGTPTDEDISDRILD